MQLDFNPENLDRYFKKQLSQAEKTAIEQKIAQDPLLKGEIDFQQEVIEAICQHRKWEIKQRLDALAPETSPLFSIPRLALGTTLTIAGILTATLFWFDNKKAGRLPLQTTQNKPLVKHIEKEKRQDQPKRVQESSNVPAIAPNTVHYNHISQNLPAPEKITEKVKILEPCLPEAQSQDEVISSQEALIKLYDEMLWFEVGNTDTDNGAFDRNSEDQQSLDRIVSNQMLRYQYYNGQLSLYNNTSGGKQIHATIEGKERHFLLYENVYYEFFDKQMAETVMQPIRDKKILSLLSEILSQVAKN